MSTERDPQFASRELQRAFSEARLPATTRRAIIQGALERARPRRIPSLNALAYVGAVVVLAAVALTTLRDNATSGAAATGVPQPATGSTLSSGPDGPMTYRLGGHQVELAARSRVDIAATAGAGHELVLHEGAARFEIQPLSGGEQFVVKTPDVVVRVVGTRFEVRREEGCTRVSVSEGKVAVRATTGDEELLLPGATQRFCPETSGEGAVAGEPLMREALALLSSNTDEARARSLLEDYLTQYPGGDFEQDALFHLWRLEAEASPARARMLAQRFVESFPQTRRAEGLRSWLDESPAPDDQAGGLDTTR